MNKTSETHQTVLLPKRLIESLRWYARQHGRSLANMAGVAIEEWIEMQQQVKREPNHNGHLGSNKE